MEVRFNSRTPTAVADLDGLVTVSPRLLAILHLSQITGVEGMTMASQNGSKQPKLLERVRIAIRTMHYSYSTEKTYIHWIRKYVLFHNKRHPGDMGEPEMSQFISHLAVNKRVSSSTQKRRAWRDHPSDTLLIQMIEKTVKKVLPGQPGTKKLMKKYGEQLVCLRYKYDSKRGHKLKTVELVIEEMPWHKSPRKIPANKNVFLTVAYGEIHLGRLVRHAG